MNRSDNVYSNSRISAFEQCPLKFRFAYVEKIPVAIPETIEAFTGHVVHASLEELYKTVMKGKPLSLTELLAFYFRKWKAEWKADTLIVKDEHSEEGHRALGEQMLLRYYLGHKPFAEDVTLAVEQHVTFSVGNESAYRLQGFIDRLARRGSIYEVHDYKTGNRRLGQGEADRDRQLALYAIAVAEKYPDAKKIELVWHYLAFGQEVRSQRTPEQLALLKQELFQSILQIEEAKKEKEFSPRPGGLCPWCEYASICPVGPFSPSIRRFFSKT